MKVILDKISSVTKNANLSHEVEITKEMKAEEGAIIVGKVLEDKKIYNQLELPSGRMSTIKKGDIVALALGNRKALKGFVGEVPSSLSAGDTVSILNLGGVAGLCTSANLKEVGHPLPVRVLGAVVGPNGPLNIKQFKLFDPEEKLESKIPLIFVSGTCMNVGKTSVACEMIKQASRKGYKVHAAKLAGVAALRDTENMKDYGAKKAISFIDAGFPSTVKTNGTVVKITKGAINYLSTEKVDLIVIEFGDGVFGEYGVMNILKDKELQANVAFHIGCAHDPMGACKLFEECKKIGLPLNVVSGPVTDNSVGVNFISRTLDIPAFNGLYQGEELFQYISESIWPKK